MPCRSRLAWGLLLVAAVSAGPLLAFEPATQASGDEERDTQQQAAQQRRERYANGMREYAQGTKIVEAKAGRDGRPAELVAHPVFRYSDEPRFIPDATLWAWTIEGRPAAFQKVEGNNQGGGRLWTICIASASEDELHATWPGGRTFRTTRPGVTFKPIPNAEAPSDRPRRGRCK